MVKQFSIFLSEKLIFGEEETENSCSLKIWITSKPKALLNKVLKI